MFRGRRQLQRKDREAGLVFGWRLPVSGVGPFVAAMVLVGLVSVFLALTVRVRIGPETRSEPEQGTLVLVPSGGYGDSLDRRAKEAGPFPLRWNPAADPEYAALRRAAIKSAADGGIPYRPAMIPIGPAGDPADDAEGDPGFTGGDFPALPEVVLLEPTEEPREITIGVRLLDGPDGLVFNLAALPLPAATATEAIGGRFAVGHDPTGRVIEVVGLSTRRRQEAVARWLSRGRVTGHGDTAGWISVETVVTR